MASQPVPLEVDASEVGRVDQKDALLQGNAIEGNGSFFGVCSWLENLRCQFGWKLLTLLFVVQHLLKGFTSAFVSAATPYLYKSYNVPAPQMQILRSVTMLPWAMKPMIGLTSDMCPISGYSKAPYVFATSVVGAVSYLIVGATPQSMLSLNGMVVCIFLAQLQMSTCDLLSEAKYAEKIRTKPKHGPDLMTFVWFGLTFGGLVAVIVSGLVIERLGPKVSYAISSLVACLVLVPTLGGYFEEAPLDAQAVAQVRARFLRQKEACALCFLMFTCTVFLTICGLVYEDPLINGILAICVALVVICGFSLVLSPVIAKFNAFSVCQSAVSISISGATFLFYTDTPEQYPEGPHFDPFFFNTVMGACGAVCSLVGIYFYNRYMSSWRYRQLFIATSVAFSCLCMLDIMMFTRVNVRLGIPDKLLVLGSSALESIVGQWMWMPQVVIMSYLCPKGMEATMYALLAGSFNLGGSIASNVGALILDRLGCRPSGKLNESVQFENLWIASAIATVMPLAAVLALIQLVPDAEQKQKIIGEDEDLDCTSGSLLKRWLQST